MLMILKMVMITELKKRRANRTRQIEIENSMGKKRAAEAGKKKRRAFLLLQYIEPIALFFGGNMASVAQKFELFHSIKRCANKISS